MKNNYFFSLILSLFLSLVTFAQEGKNNVKNSDSSEIGIYPNPATQGKIFITSKNTFSKEIKIFDTLGKVILETTINNNKELNISNIQPGMYFIQIKESNVVVTRKLIVK
jgi:hypothetical protein